MQLFITPDMFKKSYIACVFLFIGVLASSAQQVDNDTIYNPPVIFSSMPRSYEIADIQVSGNDSYEDYIVIGYSGLKIGDIIDIPGNYIGCKASYASGPFCPGSGESDENSRK